jgi:adenylate cyclase
MNPDRAIRRLAAILAADVAGYSRLIGADEGGTLERLRALRREQGGGAPFLCGPSIPS